MCTLQSLHLHRPKFMSLQFEPFVIKRLHHWIAKYLLLGVSLHEVTIWKGARKSSTAFSVDRIFLSMIESSDELTTVSDTCDILF